ncbi:ead/Ea22-like family protein [Pseudomonas aeruginosa]|uniref:ead/Ea22-like family protein n=1 Tax=Pseudomonas aeruginosa TaxID=287 RepID=UPI00300C9239
MTDHAELRRLAKAATPGPWRVQTGCSWRRIGTDNGDGDVLRPCTHPHDGWPDIAAPVENLEYIAEANPKTILALLDEIDGMKASGWRNHSVNYARAEKCPQTLETAQAAWDRDQELIEEQRQQIARDSQTINQLRQKLQSAEVDRDRLKAENEALRKDAERWRYARTILPYEVIQDAQKDFESWNVGVSEAENKRCDEAIDAALEGATQ